MAIRTKKKRKNKNILQSSPSGSIDLKKQKLIEQDAADDVVHRNDNELSVDGDGHGDVGNAKFEKHEVALSSRGTGKRREHDADREETAAQTIMQSNTNTLLLEQHMFNFLRLTRGGPSSRHSSGNGSSSQVDEQKSKKTHLSRSSGGPGGVKSDIFGSVLSLSLFLNHDMMDAAAATTTATTTTASTEAKKQTGNMDRTKEDVGKTDHGIANSDANSSSESTSKPLMLLHDSISFLLSYLTLTTTKSTTTAEKHRSVFSKAHVAGMLLPWSIQSLLYLNNNKNDTANAHTLSMIDGADIWKTCALCLETLLVGTATPLALVKVSRGNAVTTERNLGDNRSSCSRQEEERDVVLEKLADRLRINCDHSHDHMKGNNRGHTSKQSEIGGRNYHGKDNSNSGYHSGSDTSAHDDSSSRDVLASIFTNQATVNKLLSFAGHIGFGQSTSQSSSSLKLCSADSDKTQKDIHNDGSPMAVIKTDNKNAGVMSQMAARCYSLLIMSEWYRPTMDHVCTTLVPLIDDLIALSSLSNDNQKLQQQEEELKPSVLHLVQPTLQYHQVIMVEVTLQLLKTLQQQGIANPKKIFGLFSSPQVLSCLARFLQIRLLSSLESTIEINSGMQCDALITKDKKDDSAILNDITNDTTASSSIFVIPDLIQHVLWRGLFHSQLHIDGFRTMNMTVPTRRQEDDMEIEGSKKGGREGGGKSHRCYQQNLLHVLESLIKNKDVKDMVNNSQITKSKTDNLYTIQLVPLLIEGFLQKMSEWGENQKNSSVVVKKSNKKKTTLSHIDSVAQVQFRFCLCILHPMIERVGDFVQLQTIDAMAQISLNEKKDANIFLSLLRSIRQSLSLLLKYDAYLPSHNDSGDRHIGYLTMVGETVLSLIEGNTSIFYHPGCGESARNESLFICRDLFHLNHHIFHKKLHRLLKAIALQSHNNLNQSSDNNVGKRSRDIGCELFCSICNAYQKLRQLAHLLNAMLSLALEEDSSRKGAILIIFKDTLFLRTLSSAIQGSPSEQLQEFYTLLKNFISTQVKGGQYEKSQVISIQFAVDIFVLLLKAVKVQKFNAQGLLEICNDAIKFTTSNLIVKVKCNGIDSTEFQARNETNDTELPFQFDLSCAVTNMGIHLCGWIVELHTRCCFWLNKIPHEIGAESISHGITDWFGIVPTLLQTTHAVIAHQEKSVLMPKMGALQHLSCHRIQQLHSLIFQEEQIEVLKGANNEMESSKKRSNDMIEEAKHLVNFVIYAAYYRHFGNDGISSSGSNGCFQLNDDSLASGWKIIARNVTTWAPYSKPEHTVMFLNWLFFTLAVEDKEGTKRRSNKVAVLPLKASIPHSAFCEDRSAALALLHDTSFFEVKEVCDNFISVGLVVASEFIAHALADVDKHGLFKINGIELIAIPLDLQRLPLTSTQLESLIKSKRCERIEVDQLKSIHFLERSLNVLLTLNRVICQSMVQSELLCLLDTMLRLHEALRNLLCAIRCPSPSQVDLLLKMMNICRATFSANLSGLTANDSFLTPTDASFVKHLVFYMVSSSEDCMKIANSAGMEGSHSCIAGINWGGKLISDVFSFCLRIITVDKSHMCSFLFALGKIAEVVDTSTLSEDILLKVNLIRPTVIQLIHHNRCSPHKMITCDIYSLAGESIFLHLIKTVLDRIMGAMTQKSYNVHFEDEIVFVADILHLDRICRTDDNNIRELSDSRTMQDLLACVLSILHRHASSRSHSDTLKSAALYVLCSVSVSQRQSAALTDVSFIEQVQSLVVLQYIHNNGQVDPLLDSAYSELLSHANGQQITELSEKLVDAVRKLSRISDDQVISASVHCFRIMILFVDGKAQKQVLADVCHSFLYLAFEMHSSLSSNCHNNDTKWVNNVCTAQLFLCTIIERKDIVKLNSSEVSTALGNVNNFFQLSCGKKPKPHHVDNKVYLSSCEVMLILLKRYPGQLYSCPPVFICAFRSLFIYVMKTETKSASGDKMVSDAIQSFTKLCEALPAHKEVFKKHVATLIFDYIHALQDGMDLETKTQLVPAVHMLLDTLTVHETQQINVMMNLSSKAMFQVVHQQYQQKHVYKGQF